MRRVLFSLLLNLNINKTDDVIKDYNFLINFFFRFLFRYSLKNFNFATKDLQSDLNINYLFKTSLIS